MGKEVGKTEISYVEYKKALITVELFYAQIDKKYSDIKNKETKTDLRTWIINTKMGGRLRNILIDLNTEYTLRYRGELVSINGEMVYRDLPDKLMPPVFEYLEDVNKKDFLRSRNAGNKTWEEFKELRNKIG